MSVHLGTLLFEGSPPEPSLAFVKKRKRGSVAGGTRKKPHVSSRNFRWTRCDFLRKESCHWQIKMVLFVPLKLNTPQLFIPFTFLIPLATVQHVLGGREIRDILALFPVLGEKH